jgi:hypothetical protein
MKRALKIIVQLWRIYRTLTRRPRTAAESFEDRSYGW